MCIRDRERGGRTTFPKLGLGFEPRVGDAVLWWNVKDDGKEDAMTLHAGDPVLAGEKWAMNIWLRQRPRRQPKNEERVVVVERNDDKAEKREGDEEGKVHGAKSSVEFCDGVSALRISDSPTMNDRI